MIYAFEAAQESVVSPKERLKIVLTELYDFGAEHLPLVRFMIKQNIDNGDMGSALMRVPLLRRSLDRRGRNAPSGARPQILPRCS